MIANNATINANSIDFEKMNGLVPAVIQHDQSGDLLMVGFMNRDALEATMRSKKVTFFSRTKNRLWTKGETSDHFLNVISMYSDCDNDTLLIKALPDGPVCHTGTKTCFGNQTLERHSFLTHLENLLYQRKKELPENSYTTSLFKKGLDKIAQKVGEEAVETVIAAKNEDDSEFIYEASDLLFHLLLLCTEKNIPFSTLIDELMSRHKT